MFVVVQCLAITNASKDWTGDIKPERWNSYAENKLKQILTRDVNGNVAKNIILFLGDGMGPTTVTVIPHSPYRYIIRY